MKPTKEQTRVQMRGLAYIASIATPEQIKKLWAIEEKLAMMKDPQAIARWKYRANQARAAGDIKDAQEAEAWANGDFKLARRLKQQKD